MDERLVAGDVDAFSGLTEPYRKELLLHCYQNAASALGFQSGGEGCAGGRSGPNVP